MENAKEKLFSVGELAKKAGVTVRTLQYYDKIGLLKSTITDGGRRMYTQDDILKLQQILFLKSFGFSLEEIGDKILSPQSSADLEKVFVQQREILIKQIGNLSTIVNMLDQIIPEMKTGKGISVDKLMTIMDLMKQGNPYSFVIRYFDDGQLKSAADRFDSPEKYQVIMNQAEDVFAQLDSLYRMGADPAGKEGQQLAAHWWNMVNEFTGGDPNLLRPLLSAGTDIDNWPEESKKFQEAVKNFLSEALDIYLHNMGIQLSEMEECKDD